MIKIRLFANLREKIGTSELKYDYCDEKSVSELMHNLSKDRPAWASIHEHDVLVAVNQTLCSKSAQIHDGDELAFFPPVTGG